MGDVFFSHDPICVSDNGQGLATLYNGAGVKQGLVVSIPAPGGGQGAPTGQIFNPNTADFGGAHFVFATEDGSIAAWSGGTTATLPVDNSPHKELALAESGGNNYLYATDFHNNAISVFNSSFTQVTLTGNFTDRNSLARHSHAAWNRIRELDRLPLASGETSA